MALWGGRFTQEADQKFKFFNDSLRFDYRLALQDIDGSIGWAKAIQSVGILTENEYQELVAALKALRAEIEPKIEIILHYRVRLCMRAKKVCYADYPDLPDTGVCRIGRIFLVAT